MRIKGSKGSIYGIGDCVTLEPTSFPATAQVAKQQGHSLVEAFNMVSNKGSVVSLLDENA